MAVVEHGAVNHSFMAVGKMLQVLIVGGNHTISLLLAELVEYSFGDSTTYSWLCTCTKLIYQMMVSPLAAFIIFFMFRR